MAEVTAVQLKLPQFLKTSAKLWFAQTEARFGVPGFSRQLSDDVRVTLAALQLKDVCAIAAAADAMMAVRRQPHLLAVHQQPIIFTRHANTANIRSTLIATISAGIMPNSEIKQRTADLPVRFRKTSKPATSDQLRQVLLVKRAASFTFGTDMPAIASWSIQGER